MSETPHLSEDLKSYIEAQKEEWNLAKNGTSDEVAENARMKLALLLPEATDALPGIIRNGDKDDAVRLGAIKLVFEYTLGKPVAKTTKESDIERVIDQLTRKEE